MINYASRKLQGFFSLDRVDLDLLDRAIVRSRVVPTGVDLISEGENPSDVHLILSGFACRYKILKDGRRQIMAYLIPGDICDLHVFLLDQMDHSIGTLSECEVVDLPRSTVSELLDRPAIAKALLLSALVDEATLREWLVNIGQRQAEPRIAHLLCELLARYRAVGLVTNNSYRLPLTQVEIADTMGVTSVHLNRVLQSLRSRGLLTFDNMHLVILDVEALKIEAGWNPNYLHLKRQVTFEETR